MRIDKLREGCVRRVIERTGCGLATGVLRRGDDLEAAILQLLENLLPPWQNKAAPPPCPPGDGGHLPAAKRGESHGRAEPIRHFDIRRVAAMRRASAYRG